MCFCTPPRRGKEGDGWKCPDCGQNWWFYAGTWRMCTDHY